MQLRLRCVCSLPRWGTVGRRILAEKVFAYPGLGQATIDAGLRGDLPLLMGIVLFSTVLVFIGNSLSTWLVRMLNRALERPDAL
jgi:peptide/nickel transport system permease protein